MENPLPFAVAKGCMNTVLESMGWRSTVCPCLDWRLSDPVKDSKSFLSFCLACLVSGSALAADAPSAWDYSPVGQCARNYRISKPRSDSDTIVRVEKNTDAQGNKYAWSWDSGPSRNPTVMLTRITPAKIGCVILYMPYSDSHDFKLAPGGELPKKVISQSAPVTDASSNGEPGWHYAMHEYSLNRVTGTYQKVPTCYVVRNAGKTREKMACDAAISE